RLLHRLVILASSSRSPSQLGRRRRYARLVVEIVGAPAGTSRIEPRRHLRRPSYSIPPLATAALPAPRTGSWVARESARERATLPGCSARRSALPAGWSGRRSAADGGAGRGASARARLGSVIRRHFYPQTMRRRPPLCAGL